MSDLAVVGAGPIGLAVAWRAAERGLAVTVHDAGPDGAGAWYAAAGILAPVSAETVGEDELSGLLVESSAVWPAFAAELEAATGLDIGYRTEGTLMVALTAADETEARRVRDYQTGLGLAAHPRTAAELRGCEPSLALRVRGGAYLPGDRQVDPRRMMIALRAACRAAGVTFARARVSDLADLPDGRAVVAAGCGSAALTGLPVRPVKGQVLRLRPPDGRAPCFRHVIRGYAGGRPVYLVPRPGGEVVAGATMEERSDRLVTAGAVVELLRAATDLVPELAGYELAEACVRHRPATPDGAPIMGPLPWRPDVIVATGHYQNGILLAPLTAELVVQALTGPDPEERFATFGPSRFGPP
ncbi:glycine oxidase ThiO [Actinomadura sp. 9N215]|uniref:glycine oxidase ThiO n=1 Tax=Actinomadura sp. 9N215 TaxID=3375150 RepID=UPI0037B7E87B